MNRNLFVFTVLLFLLSALMVWGTRIWLQASYLFSIIFFLGLSTWLVFFFMNRKIQPEAFIKNYLLSIVLKLLAGGLFIAVIIVTDKPFANSNAILFMAGYLLFTALEVVFLFSIHNKA
jgi:hypothetical protein